MFHKELEAYIVAEGLFDEAITEDGYYSKYRTITIVSISYAIIYIP